MLFYSIFHSIFGIFVQAFGVLTERMPQLEVDVPLIKSHTAKFAARAVSDGIVTLAELAEPLHNGVRYPLYLLCLQQLHKQNDKEWLVKAFNESKVNLQDMLPGEFNRPSFNLVIITFT